MSSHDGVSCDACGKNNFRSKRYKCLICYDYDLCSTCYEQGETSSHHSAEHPMQCILTRHDFDFYYHGERYTSDQAQSLTCPFCGEMGFSAPFSNDASVSHGSTSNFDLFHHIQSKHSDDQQPSEVICPICVSMANGEPNLMTGDLLSHIANDHQQVQVQTPSSAGSSTNIFSRQSLLGRDFDLTGSSNSRSTFRRGPLRTPSRRGTLGRGGGTVSQHFVVDPSVVSGTTDPIADLLTQLSAVRRLAAASSGNTSTSNSLSPNPVTLQAITRHQQERERLRAAARAHQNSQSSNQHSQSSSSTLTNSLAAQLSSSLAATNPATNVTQTIDSDIFDSLFSSNLCIDPPNLTSSSTSNGQQTWAQVVAQQPAPIFDQSAQQSSNSMGTVKNNMNDSDPSLLRRIYEETTLLSSIMPPFNPLQTQQQKRRSDFLHSLIVSSLICPLNESDK